MSPDDRDLDFRTQLARAAYAPGMMLDTGTLEAEQDYHRRRLDRHRFWLHGAGTVCGLAVTLRAEPAPNAVDDHPVQLVVGPGVAIDGLGRDVLVEGPWCLDLLAWITADDQSLDALRDGLDLDARVLSLTVALAHADCPIALRPVLARRVNAGTDAVDHAMIRDAPNILLTPGAPPERGPRFWPWGAIPRPEGDPLDRATQAERDALPAAGPARARAEAALRRIYALPDAPGALEPARQAAEIAPVPLARLDVDLRDDDRPFVHPDHVRVTNAVRPMVPTAAELAWLAAAEE